MISKRFKNTITVHNVILRKNKVINVDELDHYLNNGYVRGKKKWD